MDKSTDDYRIIRRHQRQKGRLQTARVLDKPYELPKKLKPLKQLKVSKVKEKKIHKSLYGFVKEQFAMVIYYIDILESKVDNQSNHELSALSSLIESTSKQCQIYLNMNMNK